MGPNRSLFLGVNVKIVRFNNGYAVRSLGMGGYTYMDRDKSKVYWWYKEYADVYCKVKTLEEAIMLLDKGCPRIENVSKEEIEDYRKFMNRKRGE